jgi:hypothetical protein
MRANMVVLQKEIQKEFRQAPEIGELDEIKAYAYWTTTYIQSSA